MRLDCFLKLYQNKVFDRPIVFYLKVKTDRGFGYSYFEKIDEFLYPYFEVESFEIPTVTDGFYGKNKIELHVKITIKKQYHDYIFILIMKSKAHEITKEVE